MSLKTLHAITKEEFMRLAKESHMQLDDELLERLLKHRILRPLDGSLKHPFCALHLYILALYVQHARVLHHLWDDVSERLGFEPVEDASRLCADFCASLSSPQGMDEGLGQRVVHALHDFMHAIDPFGPLSAFVDVLRPDVRVQMRGHGRLYAELGYMSMKISALLGHDMQHEHQGVARKDAETVQISADRYAELRTTQPMMEAQNNANARAPHMASASTLMKDLKKPMLRVTAEMTPVIRTQSAAITADLGDKQNPFLRDSQGGLATQQTLDLKSKLKNMGESNEEEASCAEASSSASMHEEVRLELGVDDDEESWAEEVARAISSSGLDMASSLDAATLADVDRASSVPAKEGVVGKSTVSPKAFEDEGDLLQARISELNALRQKYYQSQNWTALVDLYEDGLELFEGEGRLQVHMMLAKLYEVKLKEPERALDHMKLAFELARGAMSAKILDAMRPMLELNDVFFEDWSMWAKKQGRCKVSGWGKRLLVQQTLASTMVERGQGEQGFWIFASFVAEHASHVMSQGVLELLEALSEAVSKDELEELYEDLLDNELEDKVAVRLALRVGTMYVDGERMLEGIRSLQRIEGSIYAPDELFYTLESLYEEECLWCDLVRLYEDRLALQPEQADVLRAGLVQARQNQLVSFDGAQKHYEQRLERWPGEPQSIIRFAQSYVGAERYGEGYAFLNRHLKNAREEDKVDMLLLLAQIAVEHLQSSEEAIIHYKHILRISPEHVLAQSALQGLQGS